MILWKIKKIEDVPFAVDAVGDMRKKEISLIVCNAVTKETKKSGQRRLDKMGILDNIKDRIKPDKQKEAFEQMQMLKKMMSQPTTSVFDRRISEISHQIRNAFSEEYNLLTSQEQERTAKAISDAVDEKHRLDVVMMEERKRELEKKVKLETETLVKDLSRLPDSAQSLYHVGNFQRRVDTIFI